ncbi:hypothetical protein ACFXGA_25775 [Actinosynnema sp. NPDC059335]|uniref:hypothetical protein n=1 Tax=Actinosynnema sp. NPDC059335 TaxID=3346804 RepID=UPI00366AEFB9
MTRSEHSDSRPSRRRTNASSPRPGGRRGEDRRPWPTAPTTTRVSPAKPIGDTTRSRSRGSASTPTPATVWTAAHPIDLDATWPAALVERIVTSFSHPAAQVVLLTWPTTDEQPPGTVLAGIDGVIDHAPGTDPNPELADAVRTIEHLDRAVRVEHVPTAPTVTDPTSRPFRADFANGTGPASATTSTTPVFAIEATARHDRSTTTGSADLVITSLPPHHPGVRAADLVAPAATSLLRAGGILAVLTHCDWTSGELTDPTGTVVTAGQNADLLYLQHIVAVHAPVRDGRLHLTETARDQGCDGTSDHSDTNDAQGRARHRALVRGLPAPHRRIHSDVLVFAQPHDHRPPTDVPVRKEDIR